MTHPNEDTLLMHALELHVDSAQREELEAHIASCMDCIALLNRIRDDLRIISGVHPHSRLTLPPFGRFQPAMRAYLRIAALLILSFAAGYITSELAERSPVTIVASIREPMSNTPGHGSAVESDATQVQYPASSPVVGGD